jgi:hypothetical protein
VVRSFAGVVADGVLAWRGTPNCQAGHDALLRWLTENAKPFRTAANAKPDDNILRGNLGEAIAFLVSYWHDCAEYRAFATNALRPFRPKSDIDLDILWLNFRENPAQDFAILQEVKTTSGTDLAYARALVDDYDKLFGTNLQLTLHTRLQDVKGLLRFQVGGDLGMDLSRRVSYLAGQCPRTSPKLQLRPTLVHELKGTKPREKMASIRTTLLGKGWSPAAVEAWAIGLTDLDDRLIRLATGRN